MLIKTLKDRPCRSLSNNHKKIRERATSSMLLGHHNDQHNCSCQPNAYHQFQHETSLQQQTSQPRIIELHSFFRAFSHGPTTKHSTTQPWILSTPSAPAMHISSAQSYASPGISQPCPTDQPEAITLGAASPQYILAFYIT